MSTPPLRVWVFIDAQNLYRDARDAFHSSGDPSSYGQVDPRKFGELVASRASAKNPRPRQLDEVRIYAGTPSSSKEPKANAAHLKQRAAWEKLGVKPFTRPLQYLRGGPSPKGREKGVDVALAVDLVFNAARRNYDVAVVASTDTDLLPALEAVWELRRAWGEPQLEVACWSPLTKRLRLAGYNLWCHHLEQADYEAIRDKTNYTL